MTLPLHFISVKEGLPASLNAMPGKATAFPLLNSVLISGQQSFCVVPQPMLLCSLSVDSLPLLSLVAPPMALCSSLSSLPPRSSGSRHSFSLCLFFFFFQDRVSLCSPSCPGTHSVVQAGLELRNLPASASQVLELKACATTPGGFNFFCLFVLNFFCKLMLKVSLQWIATGVQSLPSHMPWLNVETP